MLDDLTTRGVDEPYRMFTSRAEYRLLLRADNADRRLTPLGRKLGLVDDERWARFEAKERSIRETFEKLETTFDANGSILKFLRRPETEWSEVVARIPELAAVSEEVAEEVCVDAKYAGYVERQEREIAARRRWDARKIPATFRFRGLSNLRAEAQEKLEKIRPTDLGQASRVPGITPADIAVLTVYLERDAAAQESETGEKSAE